MKRSTLVQLAFTAVFAVSFTTLGTLYRNGTDNWLTTALTWFLTAIFCLFALILALAVLLWVLKMLGVIAKLPFTLDRKLKEWE